MLNSFRNLTNNQFDRNFGGTEKGTADPYISGYSFVLFKVLPPALPAFVNHDSNNLGIKSNENIGSILSSSCMAVTPPGGTLNKTEFPGLGGIKYSVPTNIDYGNSLSMRFLEFSGLPLLHVFHGWFRMIREYRTGTSPLAGAGGITEYTKRNYTASVLYWTTKPNGIDVEYYAYYTGVFPTKDPQELFVGDLASSDKVEIDMDFSIDWVWRESWVRDLAVYWAAQYKNQGANFHGSLGSNGANLGRGSAEG